MTDRKTDLPEGWERETLEKVLLASLTEQRRARKWNNFFKGLFFLYLLITLIALSGWFSTSEVASTGPHTALIDLKGVIDAEGQASAEKINASLDQAFKDANTRGVIIRINSPGGSPVQAGYINDEIKRQRAIHPDTPIYAVIMDLCASGGYYVAAAADKIYVDKASLVGSIGVTMDGFGFVPLMQKLGVERRALHAGDNKNFLDPFSPVNPEQIKHAERMLDQIHQQFIGVVREGRKGRLHEEPDLFSGLIWTGEESIRLGLADDFGSAEHVARDVIKAPEIVDFTNHENIAERLAKKIGAGAVESVDGWSLKALFTLH